MTDKFNKLDDEEVEIESTEKEVFSKAGLEADLVIYEKKVAMIKEALKVFE